MELAQHTRFVDSDEEDGRMQMQPAEAAVPAQPAALPTSAMSLVSTISTDYDQKDQCYVLHLAASPTGAVAAALSNRRIKLFALKESGLQFAGDLGAHRGLITSAACLLPEEPHLLHTSSADGTACEWDLRTPGQPVRTFAAGNQEMACCATNGSMMAAGARDNVLFWDRGSGKPMASFCDTHFQDVTQVAFHPTTRSALLSGSEDGLIAVFDTAGGLDEDEGWKAALNLDNAVAKFGFYGPAGAKLWCCSGTETLHLWEWAAACDDEAEGGNGQLGQALDARELLGASMGGQPADYLTQCEYDASTGQLVVAAGRNDGGAGLFAVGEPPSAAGAAAAETGPLQFGSHPVATFQGGHTDVVRSMVWLNGSGPVWVTGGEDARVCVWTSSPAAAAAAAGAAEGNSDGAARHQGHHMRRASPY